MLSESQERMLLVVKRGREREVEDIFEKWDLHAAHIGEVTDDGLMRVRERGTVVAEIPTGALTDDAPVSKRPMATPSYLAEVQKLSLPDKPPTDDVDALRTLLASPAIASKRWVYRAANHMVRTNTLVLPQAWEPEWFASRAPIARLPCLSMATAATAISIRIEEPSLL